MSFKKCDVVMLATEKKAAPIMLGSNLFANMPGVLRGTKFHLYFINHEDMKYGDWFIFFGTQGTVLHQFHSDAGYGIKTLTDFDPNDDSSLIVASSKCSNKIIASTDPLLNNGWIRDMDPFKLSDHVNLITMKGLPKPSTSFISKYLDAYNTQEIIYKVMIEFEIAVCHCDPEEVWCYCSSKESLKVNPKDNTITIKKLKDVWTKKEIQELIYIFAEKYVANMNTAYQKQNINKWLTKNLEDA